MALVLCTGSDVSLISTRKSILEQAGHTVVTATGEPELLAACSENKFDVAVIGQGVPANEKFHILRLVREQCPSAKVLELFSSDSARILNSADDWLEVSSHASGELATRVSDLASKQPKLRRA